MVRERDGRSGGADDEAARVGVIAPGGDERRPFERGLDGTRRLDDGGLEPCDEEQRGRENVPQARVTSVQGRPARS